MKIFLSNSSFSTAYRVALAGTLALTSVFANAARSQTATAPSDSLERADLGQLKVADATLDARGRALVLTNNGRLLRRDDSGAPDAAFDANAARAIATLARNARVSRVTTQIVDGAGKIVLVGTQSGAVFVLRLNNDGTRDARFGARGLKTVRFNAPIAATAVAIDDSNRVLVGLQGGVAGARDLQVLRLTENGALDRNFGSNGIATDARPGDQTLTGLVAAGDAVVLSGKSDSVGVLEKFSSTGALDRGFGQNGRASIVLGKLGVQRLARDSRTGALAVLGSNSIGALTIARFSPQGQLDKSFGANGFAGEKVGAGTGADTRQSVSLNFDENGALLLTGGRDAQNAPFVTMRFGARGELLKSAASNGSKPAYSATPFANYDPFGRLVVVGTFGGVRNAARSVWARFPASGAMTPATRVVNIKAGAKNSPLGASFAFGGKRTPLGRRVAEPLQRLYDEFSRGRSSSAKTFTVRNNRVLVNISVTGASGNQQLQKMGFQQTGRFGAFVSGYLPIASIPALENASGVTFASPDYGRQLHVGATTSQGDLAQRSDVARANGVTGAGQKIGVLSDSYNALGTAQTDLNSGDLSPVQLLPDDTASGNTDEGRAMLQIVHDVAPGASLAFATANGGKAAFAQHIIDLKNAGCGVIVDDVGYFAEPMFMDGIISRAVDQVFSGGAAYFSSAGNSARKSYESDFRNSGVDFTFPNDDGSTYKERMHDFDPGSGVSALQPFTIGAGQRAVLVLQWDDAFKTDAPSSSGAQNDVDVYVLSDDGQTLFSQSIDANIGGDPIEILSLTNSGDTAATANLAIGRASGTTFPHFKYIIVSGDLTPTRFATNSGTSYGHPIAAGCEGVAAAPYNRTPRYGVTPPQLESFSSAGGLAIRRDPNGNPIAPVIRRQPAITAPDGANTTFFGQDADSDGFPNFFGTSAAAPHAAGVAALLRQRKPSLTPAQVYAALQNTAIDVTAPGTGYDFDSGYGLINAETALASVSVAPTPTPAPSNSAPVNVSLSPSTVTDAPNTFRTFMATYSDANGVSTLKSGCIVVGNSATLTNGIFCYLDVAANKLVLVNEARNGVIGSAAPGATNNGAPIILSHSRGSLDVTNTTVSRSQDGKSITINWRLSAKSTLSGAQPVSLFTEDTSGGKDGWDRLGTWTISGGSAPINVSLSPTSASDAPNAFRTFSATYSDPDGVSTLKSGCIVIGDNSTLINSLFCYLDVQANKLYLVNENLRGSQGGVAPGTKNNGATLIVSNGMGSLDLTNTTVGRSQDGKSLTINWRLSAKSTLSGAQPVSLFTEDTSGGKDGWDRLGTWTVTGNAPPQNVGVSPNQVASSANAAQTFITTTRDLNGWQNLDIVYFRVNSLGSNPDANAIVLGYNVRQNKLYLRNDPSNAWLGGVTPGTNTVIGNSQGVLNVINSKVISASGNDLVLQWSITPTAPYKGTHTLQLGASDQAGTYANYQNVGAWTIQ